MPKHLFFLGFWVYTADCGFPAGRRKVSVIFLRCLSRKSGSQHQLCIKTLPSGWFQTVRCQKSCRTKVPRTSQIFVPNFSPNVAPNFPRIFEEFSCFVPWEAEARKNSPKIPAIFSPRQIRRKNPQKFSGGPTFTNRVVSRFGLVRPECPFFRIFSEIFPIRPFPLSPPIKISSSLMGSLAKGSLRKACGNSAENLRKFCRKYVSLRQERVRKFCGKFADISRRLRKIFCNDPFPNDPISELLIKAPTRNSPKRVRDTIRTFSDKGWKPPGLETSRFSFSQLGAQSSTPKPKASS